jgi:hypothetical protein
MNYKDRDDVDLHVIDAIDEKWLQVGMSQALMLRYFLRQTEINIVSHAAWDEPSLKGAIANVTDYRSSYCDPRRAIPYVHIFCHGEEHGLYLGDAPLLPWAALSEDLFPLQRRTDYNVPISLCSCFGYYGSGLADAIGPSYKKNRPYYSLVGPIDETDVAEVTKAFAVFYDNLLRRFRSLEKCVECANEQTTAKLDYTYGSPSVGAATS